MDNLLLSREIVELNLRYMSLITRAAPEALTDLCLALNVSVPVLRVIRAMSHDEIVALANSGRCLVQPAVDEVGLLHAASIQNPMLRAQHLGASTQVRHEVAQAH